MNRAGSEGSMDRFVPYEKLSKKAQKEFNAKKRSDWGLCNPATRQEENRKAYKRHAKHRNNNPEE